MSNPLPQGLPIKPYRPTSTPLRNAKNPVLIKMLDASPPEQWVRLALPKEVIEAELARQKRAETWDKVDLNSLGLVAELTGGPLGEKATVALQAADSPTDAADSRGFALRLLRPKVEAVPTGSVEAPYRGQTEAMPTRLFSRYQLKVLGKDGSSLASAPVAFDQKSTLYLS